MNKRKFKLAGIIPAAGSASRISPIPCSKEILPIGFKNGADSPQIKVAASDLLESYAEAGADQVYMIIRKGKWDIPQYLGVGLYPEYTLSYIITEPTPGTHYTINLAYPFVKDKIVLLGFPDILFRPISAFTTLLKRLEKSGGEVVLGLFKTSKSHKADMVDIDEKNRINNILIKPKETTLQYCWTIAVWTPVFTEYLHNFITGIDSNEALRNTQQEIFIGNVIQNAIKDGLAVQGVKFEDGNFTDIGTIPALRNILNGDF